MASGNLPIQLTSFIGRARDLAEVERLLSTARLVTLTGAGGSGKTRLAIQVANSISDTFLDQVWLVELAPLCEPELVPQLVLQAFGLNLALNQPVLETLLNYVRPKQMLIILDNCEHLSAACAQIAQQLLSQASELRILATSREPLAIQGERIYLVSGLTRPALSKESVRNEQNRLDLQAIMDYDAVHLFVERASANSPNFTLTSENAEVVGKICQRLDGLPLALELASARVNVLTVQEIDARLDDRFALLTSGLRRGLEPRHHTLRAAIDWSYALLTADEQAMLRRLAVFAAGCTLDMAEAVCSGDRIAKGCTLDLLTSLVNKSLLVAETTERAQARYRLLETIREYVLEKLEEAGETRRLHDRHLDLFLARAEEAAPKLGEAYQQLWLNWLEGELENLRAALAWALESNQIEAGLRIAIALTRFWEIRGYVQEGLIWFERLLAQVDERISLPVHVNALTFASFLAMFLNNASAAMAYGREAVDLAETAGEQGQPVLALALGALASGARTARDFPTAFAIQERFIAWARKSGDAFYLGMSLLAQGGVAIELGHYDIAREALDESLAIAREAGDAFRIAHALNSIGDLARCEQKYEDAQSTYENSVAFLREVGAKNDLASVLHNLGHTCLHMGDIERAHALFCESLAIHQMQQNVPGMAECLVGFAAIALLQGLPAIGARLLGASVTIGEQRTTTASVWHVTRMEYELYLDLARVNLTEAEFQTEHAAGSTMSLEQAVDYALSLPLKPGSAPPSIEKPDGLTVREREIAVLIGQGKTNGEIAAELFLSKRTVETHVSNILSKLGLTSRGQVMRWAINHGLTQTPA